MSTTERQRIETDHRPLDLELCADPDCCPGSMYGHNGKCKVCMTEWPCDTIKALDIWERSNSSG